MTSARPSRPRRHRRPPHPLVRALRLVAVTVVAGALMSPSVAGFYVASIEIPADPVVPQASVLYYRDGNTVLARLGTNDRTDVPLAHVPDAVRNAVLAAEDRGFYAHAGVSARGVARAAWTNATNGARQGASTITQQLVRNAYLSQERTISRKARETGLAVRIEMRLTKDEIFQRYLNTVYFGRGAYGIQAAAQAYFGTTVDRLNAEQGAVLAAVIKDPWWNDPAHDRSRAEQRWRWVVDRMADEGWVDRATATYPAVAPRSATAAALSGPLGLIADRVEQELRGIGISGQQLRTGGLRVVTTIDATAQAAATTTIGAALAGQPAELRGALVAVDPLDGGVRAYYGGDQGRGYFDDAVAPRPPASTFKPLALAAGLTRGYSYRSTWDGSSPQTFRDRHGVPLRNRKDIQCPVCRLDRAMVESLNTPFYALTEKVGPDRVRQLAVLMGIPESYGTKKTLVDLTGEPEPGKTRADIALGRYAVAPADLATVYGTFAAGGVRADRHFVRSVTGPGGERHHIAKPRRTRVLNESITTDVTTVLSGVVEADGPLRDRPAAAKTGTQQFGNSRDNQDAWTAGYTPQLAAVTWIGRAEPGPIRRANGESIEGNGIPYVVWKNFMDAALDGVPAVPLPGPTPAALAPLAPLAPSALPALPAPPLAKP